MVQRSRTGCLTCRHRKLKCDEQKPVCSQCRKATRECVPSQGIVFRHHQNASMNTGNEPGASAGLDQFYRYKKNFDPQTTVWVEIPKDITFVEVTNPYAEDGDAGDNADNAAAYQSVQTPEDPRATWSYADPASRSSTSTYTPNGLTALSEAAMDQYAYMPQASASDPAGMRSLPSYAPYEPQDLPLSPTTSRQLMPPPASPSTTAHTNVRYLLNPGGGMSDVIDPNLQMPMEQQVQVYGEQKHAANVKNGQQNAVSGQAKVTRPRVSSTKPRRKQ